MYRHYKKSGHNTFILIGDETGFFPDTVEKNDRVVIPKSGYLGFFEGISYSRLLAKKIGELKIRVVHSWDYRSELWELLACRISGTPYVFTKKNNAWSKKWWLKSFLSTHIAYDHPGMLKRFFNQGWFRRKTTFIPHGVDTELFQPDTTHREISHIIGCIGNIGQNKNQMLILKAIAECSLPLRCRFYGNSDAKYLGQLQEFIRDHELNDRVEIMGFVENDKLPGVIKDLDIVILPSYNEGLPVILLEAMACGVYCLASHSGGGSEYIINQCGAGELFDPDNSEQLRMQIEKFYADPAKKQSEAKIAVSKIGMNFSLQHEGNEYLSLFEKL